MCAFDLARVEQAVQGTLFSGKLHHFTSIDSTQVRALQDAQRGAEAGHVYIADEQTAGRGRGGHRWHSRPDDGLYLSVLVRPQVDAVNALKLSLATGIAVQSALMAVSGYAADLRWPNDIVTPPVAAGAARRLGGILTETAIAPDGSLKHAVIGIGLNLDQASFPGELAGVATSLYLETGRSTAREDLLATLLLALESELQRLHSEAEGTVTQPFLNGRFLLSSTWARGKRVRVQEEESYTGTTDGLTSAGLLRVRCDDGHLRLVRHGGVREL